MNKKNSSFILIIIIILFLAIIGVVIYKSMYKINLDLVSDEIKVNYYDNIDLRQYVKEASDNNGKDLMSKLDISIVCDDLDIIDGDNLIIRGYGDKIITYKVSAVGKTQTKKLVLKVISDPFDPDYKSNDNIDDMPESDENPVIIDF